MCQETRDFKGNTSNLWSHLAKSKDEQHIEAHNSIKDKCQPPKKKTMTADNVPERLVDHETDVENDEREDSNPVPKLVLVGDRQMTNVLTFRQTTK